jgi:transposase InsO family protein
LTPSRATNPTENLASGGSSIDAPRTPTYCRCSAAAFRLCSEVSQRFPMSRAAIGAASLPRPLNSTSSSTRRWIPPPGAVEGFIGGGGSSRDADRAPRPDPYTYVRTWAGWVYVAFILDVFAQRIVAWHAATSKDVELVMTPLRMAIWQRDHDGRPILGEELICHADAGSQCTSLRFTEHLEIEGIKPSIGSVGDAYDNALMETLNGSTRPSASAPRSSTTGPTRPSRTSSTPPPAGSTGTTSDACTGRLA